MRPAAGLERVPRVSWHPLGWTQHHCPKSPIEKYLPQVLCSPTERCGAFTGGGGHRFRMEFVETWRVQEEGSAYAKTWT